MGITIQELINFYVQNPRVLVLLLAILLLIFSVVHSFNRMNKYEEETKRLKDLLEYYEHEELIK